MKYKALSEDIVEFIMTSRDKELAVLTVSELARWFEIDRFKLARKFKTFKKATLEFYLHREKMFRSAFLLAGEKNITVQEVAKRMGFCTCYYFSQVFKKFFGIAPGKYKEYKQMRSAIRDRRIGPGNRRQNPQKGTSNRPERRKGSAGRRKGLKDRRADYEKNTDRVSIQALLRMMS